MCTTNHELGENICVKEYRSIIEHISKEHGLVMVSLSKSPKGFEGLTRVNIITTTTKKCNCRVDMFIAPDKRYSAATSFSGLTSLLMFIRDSAGMYADSDNIRHTATHAFNMCYKLGLVYIFPKDDARAGYILPNDDLPHIDFHEK